MPLGQSRSDFDSSQPAKSVSPKGIGTANLPASSKIKEPIEVESDIGNNYIEIAENIIAQVEVFRKTERITMLEAIRHINKIKPGKNLSFYTSKLI